MKRWLGMVVGAFLVIGLGVVSTGEPTPAYAEEPGLADTPDALLLEDDAVEDHLDVELDGESEAEHDAEVLESEGSNGDADAAPSTAEGPADEPTAPEPKQSLKRSMPTISGNAKKSGATLTVKPGAWTEGVEFTYQWYRNGAAISGATGAKYKLKKTDRCKQISVKVSGTKDGYRKATRTSKKLSYVACPEAKGNVIRPGQRLAPGKRLVSKNKKHVVRMQKNGKVVVFNHGRVRWSAKAPKGSSLVLRLDGKLVLQKGAKVHWRSKGSGKNVKRAVARNNGNFSLIRSNGKTAWSVAKAKAKRSNSKSVPFYSQWDRRWSGAVIGGRSFGPTGCVPAAFAMAARAYGVKVTPRSVGKQMNRHGDFNKRVAGAGGRSIVKAASQNGLMATPLKSKSAIKKALKNRQPVVALVSGPSQVTRPGTTHAVVLTKYSKGVVTLRNPGGISTQKLSLNTLWKYQSYDSLDRNASNAVFWAIG